MNAAQRKAIAAQLREVLERHGALVEVGQPERNGFNQWEISVDAIFPGIVNVSLDVSDLHKGGSLASWYNAQGPLNQAVFPSVNTCHFHKATSYCETYAGMVSHLDDIGAAIAAGKAFGKGVV